MPLSAYLDSTQRWALMGGINNRLTEFVDEVASHEVSHQWCGNMVGWASYHDQWLSEGFAFFSASLFLQFTGKEPGEVSALLGAGAQDVDRKKLLRPAASGSRARVDGITARQLQERGRV